MAEREASGEFSVNEEVEAPASSLSDALDDLEEMLGTTAVDEPCSPQEADPPDSQPEAHSTDPPTAQTARQRFLDAQYSIPLLDDVVLPGSSRPEFEQPADTLHTTDESVAKGPPDGRFDETVSASSVTHSLGPSFFDQGDYSADDVGDEGEEYDEASPPQADLQATRLAARLASELEVIVDSKAQAAMRGALDEIKREVRRHIKIVLPEILDELAQKNSDRE